nr:dTDP-4-dehydrorhamnose 3,5-epimerase [Methylobacterium sp. ZNC0032]
MILSETRIPGVFIVDLAPFADERGHFARCYCTDVFARHGIRFSPLQCNLSFNPHPGTLRGLHYQAEPVPDAKLVRCSRGAIFDVAVDLRDASPTRGEWVGVELDAANGRALFLPEGCAHGFQTLRPDSEVFYMMGAPYRADLSRGLRWNDPAFGIDWPNPVPRLNARDAAWPDRRA